MKVTWLGQAGLLFEIGNKIIMIDPYLSDSLSAISSQYKRRVPVDARFLEITPDIIILTHIRTDPRGEEYRNLDWSHEYDLTINGDPSDTQTAL